MNESETRQKHTLVRVDWQKIDKHRNQIDRNKLREELKLDEIAHFSKRVSSYREPEILEITEVTSDTLEDLCGVLEIDPKNFLIATQPEQDMNQASAHVKKNYSSDVPLIEISTKTLDDVIKSLGDCDAEKNKEIADKLVIIGLVSKDTVEAFINDMQQSTKLVYFVMLLAHEMYHIRQYLQDKTFYENTMISAEESEEVRKRAYYGNQGEMAARGFSLRYLREKIKLLKTKKNLSDFEQKLLSAMKYRYQSAEERVKNQAAYGRGKSDSLFGE